MFTLTKCLLRKANRTVTIYLKWYRGESPTPTYILALNPCQPASSLAKSWTSGPFVAAKSLAERGRQKVSTSSSEVGINQTTIIIRFVCTLQPELNIPMKGLQRHLSNATRNLWLPLNGLPHWQLLNWIYISQASCLTDKCSQDSNSENQVLFLLCVWKNPTLKRKVEHRAACVT